MFLCTFFADFTRVVCLWFIRMFYTLPFRRNREWWW